MADSTPILQLEGVTKRFGGLVAVDQASFEVGEGEIVGLIGPNGAGKSTLVNLITGLDTPSGGDISYLGRSIRAMPAHERARLGIARTFQISKPLVGMTVHENVIVGSLFGTKGHITTRAGASRKADEALERVGLREKANWSIDDITTADRKALELARALATGPRLLVLDEVMAGLHPIEVADKIAMLRQLNEDGLTMLVIEHVMKVVMSLSNRVVVLHHGQKIAEGSPAVVCRDEMVIHAYLGRRYVESEIHEQINALG